MKTSPCKGCGRPLYWVKTANGSPHPLDAEPTPDGNAVIIGGVVHFKRGDLFEEMIDDALPRYRSHFETCPEAAKFRRRARPMQGPSLPGME